MIPNLLGNIADWSEIYRIAKKYKLKVIEIQLTLLVINTKKAILVNFQMQ